MAQGFDKSRNLNESSLPSRDERIVNNLYGDNIADDLKLFIGNLRNTSTMPSSAYDLIEDSTGSLTIIKVKADQSEYVGLSNRTRIKVGLDVFFVTDSDGQTIFSLKESNGQYVDFSQKYGSEKQDLVREDFILYENFSNFKRQRLETSTEDPNLDAEIIGGLESVSVDVYTPERSLGLINGVYDTITFFNFKQSQVLLTYKDNNFYQKIRINGTIRLTNNDEIERPAAGSNDEDVAPGLFITDLQGTAYRAFGDMYNPWAEVGTFLESDNTVSSTEISYLVLGDSSEPSGEGNNSTYNININSGTVFNNTDSGDVISDFNSGSLYKLKVVINNQPYYLFMKQ